MKPIDTLVTEHRLIERVLEALVGYLKALDRGPATREDLRRFTDFIRGFADAVHHGKEEDVLFRTMADHDMPLDDGPLAVMLHEHELGRGLVRELAGAAAARGHFTPAETSSVRKAARGYVDLLRSHIMKEDQILYPMAQRLLPPEEWLRMAARFEEIDRAREGEIARLRAVAEDLAARFAG